MTAYNNYDANEPSEISSIPTPVQQFGSGISDLEVSLQLRNGLLNFSCCVRVSHTEGHAFSTTEHSSGQMEDGGSMLLALPHGMR